MEKDPVKALEWMKSAAWLHNPHAQAQLGQWYQFGICTQPDLKVALRWYWQAAASQEPTALYSLGRCYVLPGAVLRSRPGPAPG